MSSPRILLLAEQKNDYVCTQMKALQRGFILHGADCRTFFYDDAEMAGKQIRTLQPDVVMEINGSRGQSPCGIPDEVRHIAWIQDVRTPSGNVHYIDPAFGGSDIYYTLLDPDYFCLDPAMQPDALWRILHTGVDNATYHPDHTPVREGTASLCGYIPVPFHRDGGFMERVMIEHGARTLTHRRLIDRLLEQEQVSVNRHGYATIHALICDEMEQALDIRLSARQMLELIGTAPIMAFLDTEIPRMTSRSNLIHAARRAGMAVSLYGPDSWQYWSEFGADYKGMLNWPSDLARVYRQTQLNLHNGAFGMHSRVLDCMGSGGVILVNENRNERGSHRIDHHFEPGTHYIAYDEDAVDDVIAHWRHRHGALAEMRQMAAEAVARAHQWHHRAGQILQDLAQVTTAERQDNASLSARH